MKKMLTGTLAFALIAFISGCGSSFEGAMGEMVQIEEEVADLAGGLKDVAAVEAVKPRFEALGKRTAHAAKNLRTLNGTQEDMQAAAKKFEARAEATLKKTEAIPPEVRQAVKRILEETVRKEMTK